MPAIFPFKALLPADNETASRLICLPYDVMDTNEARHYINGDELSFIHVIRPDADIPDGENGDSSKTSALSGAYFKKLVDSGALVKDDDERLYVYEETFNGRTQRGVVGLCSAADYRNGKIRIHEHTFPAKVADRTAHFLACRAQTEPVFFFAGASDGLEAALDAVCAGEAGYDLVHEGVRQRFWKTNNEQTDELQRILEANDVFYIADGHHRTQAASEADADYMMAVIFDEDELAILDYNRLIRDLNGLTPRRLLDELERIFTVRKENPGYRTGTAGTIALYLDSSWYSLTLKEAAGEDPVKSLDCEILQDRVLTPIFEIPDIRNSNRIDFAGGTRGYSYLSDQVDSGAYAAAFALFPVTLSQLRKVADASLIMPPKSTWFEPKLRSGLFVYQYEGCWERQA